MATFAVGDIHGHDDALTVVVLGDTIDRGPSPKRSIERILTFRSSTAARAVALRGNHEDRLLQMDAFDTIASYSKDAARPLSSAAALLGPRLVSERVALP